MTSTFSFTQPFVLTAALIERDGKFLLLEENQGEDKGYWNLPSGKLDLGESPLEGVKREVKEESGLEFEPGAVVLISSNIRRRAAATPLHAFRIVFIGKAVGEVSFDNNEIDEHGDREMSDFRWVTRAELKTLPMRQPDVLAAVDRYLSGKSFPLDFLAHFEWERPPLKFLA
jgi:ADP-ribose pyrophosphatase YjhB (NUDIX family)